jgi:hypothetical protein
MAAIKDNAVQPISPIPGRPDAKATPKSVAVERRDISFYDPKLGGPGFEDYTNQLEKLLKHYIGETSYQRVLELARGHGHAHALHFFKERLYLAFESWDFDAVNAVREKRKPEDSKASDVTQAQLIELISYPLWEKLCDKAREQDVSNLAALKAGVAMALSKHAF